MVSALVFVFAAAFILDVEKGYGLPVFTKKKLYEKCDKLNRSGMVK